ncbi:MAG: ABC transporter permease [Chloroflexota bacterium]|nr:ABC transporter permease [Chloroflexota bacterium]MDE2960147.1 ABC transporter permease [Chloroflexota bacterium]
MFPRFLLGNGRTDGGRHQASLGALAPAGVAATVIYVLFIGLPIVALLARAGQQEGFLAGLTGELVLQALRLTVITSVVSMVVVVVVGTPFALLLARRRSTLLRVIDTFVELPIVLPPVVAGVAMLMAFGRNGLLGPALGGLGVTLPFTTAAVIFAQVFVAAPFYVRAARIGFAGVDPTYEEVSQTLGVSPWATFWRLTLPVAWPSLLTGLTLAWARAVSEFGATIMFAGNLTGRTQTMPLAIMTAMESSLGSALALAVLLLAMSALALAALSVLLRRNGSTA